MPVIGGTQYSPLYYASGVLAVVVCGLALSQVGPRLVRAETRQQAEAFWTLATFVLNASLFVLVGLVLRFGHEFPPSHCGGKQVCAA